MMRLKQIAKAESKQHMSQNWIKISHDIFWVVLPWKIHRKWRVHLPMQASPSDTHWYGQMQIKKNHFAVRVYSWFL